MFHNFSVRVLVRDTTSQKPALEVPVPKFPPTITLKPQKRLQRHRLVLPVVCSDPKPQTAG